MQACLTFISQLYYVFIVLFYTEVVMLACTLFLVGLGSQLTNTTQVLQEQESFGPEAKPESLFGAQCHETTPIVEKTASSMPSIFKSLLAPLLYKSSFCSYHLALI